MPDNTVLFGHVAVELGFITKTQLLDAARLKNDPNEERTLGQLMLGVGLLTEDQVRQVLAEQRRRQSGSTGGAHGTAPVEPVEGAAPPPPETGAAPRCVAELPTLRDMLRAGVSAGASDIHLHSGSQARLRLHGRLEPLTRDELPAAFVEKLVAEALDDAQRADLDASGQVDTALDDPELGRFRINAFRQQKGYDIVMRVIPRRVRDLTELSLSNELARFTTYHQGLVLVTGPSGCGKTSTLAALVDLVNQERRDHIITAEDPIEYIHQSKRCVVNQRQVGVHSSSFPSVLRAALREDPDVIVLGELRDLETVSLALTAAETGHLVLGTLHTGGAIRTISRLIGLFPPDEQAQVRVMLAESLRAVISQRLVRRADGTGRVPALEIMVVTRAIANLIRESKVFQIRSMLQTGRGKGMRLLEDSLAELVKRGTITQEEARIHA